MPQASIFSYTMTKRSGRNDSIWSNTSETSQRERWSQSKLAEKLGLSASQVANYEMGRRLPSLQILIDMARILGVSTDYLLGVENETKQILDVSDLTSEEISSVFFSD